LIWLIPALLLSFGFGQLFKHAQRRGCYAPAVVSANYLTIALLLLAYHLAAGQLQPAPRAFEVGAFIGLFFILAMLLMTRGLELAAVGAVLTSFRLAILIPIWASVWLWGETLTPAQGGGIALALVALALMTRGQTSSRRLSPLRGFGLLALIFAGQGIAFCGMRWVHYAGLDARFLQVLLFISLTAGALGALFILWQDRRPRRQDLLMGAGIGLYNLLALSVNLVALSKVPGTLYFPLQGCAVVILDNLFAQFWWKEPLSRPAMAGAALGVLAMILVL
jgi:drug/metabolite transporter (DMT)-like permease